MQHRQQILLIEDNMADVVMMRKAIDALQTDADVRIINDGKAATQFFDAADSDPNSACPDLILLDFNLPKKNGDDVLKHLRASTRCRNATVLIVSTSDAQSDQNAIASLGIAGYFKKPSDYTEYMKLGPLVKRLLDAPPANIERN